MTDQDKTEPLRVRADARRHQRTMATLLMTAYLQSKALTELMFILNSGKTSSGFTIQERAAIDEAHKAVATAYTELNKVICDQGNELGLEHTKALLQAGD